MSSASTYQHIAHVIHYLIEHRQASVSLADIAHHTGYSPGHIQKCFRQWVGISPKQFLRYLRLTAIRERLVASDTLAQMAWSGRLSGTGRLHDLFVDMVAMTPAEYRDGGRSLAIDFSVIDSPFGCMLVAHTSRGICHVSFGDHAASLIEALNAEWPAATFRQKTTLLQKDVERMVKGLPVQGNMTLHVRGTNFQLQIWQALLSIPEGHLSSYGDIAQYIGKPNAARAVGTAVGKNSLAYVIPCHRVLRASGAIGGYRWGKERKQAMIGYEAVKAL